MTRTLEPTKFTSLQKELLGLYAINPSEEELLEIRDMLAKYFLRRAIASMSSMEQRRGTTEEDLENLLNDDNQ